MVFSKYFNSKLLFVEFEQQGEFVLSLLSENKQAIEMLFLSMCHKYSAKLLQMYERLCR